MRSCAPERRERPGPAGSLDPLPPLARRSPRASRPPPRAPAHSRRWVRLSVPLPVAYRAKLAHLSSAGAASTFKSRSSFSFTFCLLPSRARVTWDLAPPPIGCARRGVGSGGPAPSTEAGSQRGCRHHQPSAWAREPEPVAQRKLERGRLAPPRLESRGLAAWSRPPSRAASGTRTKPRVFSFKAALEQTFSRLTLALGAAAAALGVPARFLELGGHDPAASDLPLGLCPAADSLCPPWGTLGVAPCAPTPALPPGREGCRFPHPELGPPVSDPFSFFMTFLIIAPIYTLCLCAPK